ncbi:hypothetical protein [Streptomyces sp. CRN 30]|uniref:hypothetical protein n=1 Tax=Streptomyces sp. CRN 30 TaxID=3075613 RepID=UPI002A80EADD|nr:hypothetical protein [Streptomyces sp. CRN 30]
MSETTGHESYSFACMRCGSGWEQSYEIEHHTDAEGRPFVTYVAEGRVVPSPLSRPTCHNCDGHTVRIMRPGRVASAREAAHRPHAVPHATPAEAPTAGDAQRHWHVSDLLHALHLYRKAS